MAANAELPSSPPPTDTPGLRANRACRPCVQIKAKCVPLEGSINSICVRCHRLGKPCTTPAPLPRKRRNNGKPTRVAQLEEKINTLTNLLTSNDGPPPARLDPVAAPSGSSQHSQPAHPPISESGSGDPNGLWSASLLTPTLTPPTGGRNNNAETIQAQSTATHAICCGKTMKLVEPAGVNAGGHFRVTLAPVLEEKLFSDFRTQMNIHFPFVVIPPQATAVSLREEKRFLFRTCITAAAQADPPLLRQLADDLMRYIGEHILMKGEKSLDLLQGLLVFCSWFQYYNHNNPQVMNLLHLATAMATDLGLNRPKQPAVLAPIGMVVDAAEMFHGKLVNNGVQTFDDRRALLGVYYLSGHFSSCFRRSDPMSWTQHLEDCCNALVAAAEYPSDIYAVQLVRLHRVIEVYSPSLGLMTTSNVPLQSLMRCLERDLQQYQESIPSSLAGNNLFQMQIQSAYLCLYETIFAVQVERAYHRAEALHACLSHISQFFDSLEAIPWRYVPNLTFSFWLNLVHALVVLAKMSFLVLDGWDLQSVRDSEMNFPSTVDRLVQKLETVSHQSLSSGDTPASNAVATRFSLFAEKMRLCKKWYASKLNAEASISASSLETGALPENMPMEELFGGFEDSIWPDLTADWNANIQF
ncbi:uncharacterized protein Z520_09724 [Fonsecaea multimorphosa CBS 102226]|uniref:Zn(2)-C6 fungal-type domain-containing protein n=1 Tax=Fonsecaea multimorphosa CBS 102226 TaxID=1442371 RepID=A0A0D2KD82_9EURO|nr:uncharacterized protein Z520_09724 [Fonsecaea multimorphosa CBS 102226]KIX94678.1 hypothetical protein Z520_09724 [Fonsecaea multimorphosa CBS 102226]OAL20200.1 hypothetical protein AYO22_09094 [Fonsecaea multimorphosa]